MHLILSCQAYFSDVLVSQDSMKAVMDQMGRDQTVAVTSFGTNLALGNFSALKLLLGLTTELVIGGCSIKSTFCCMSQYD